MPESGWFASFLSPQSYKELPPILRRRVRLAVRTKPPILAHLIKNTPLGQMVRFLDAISGWVTAGRIRELPLESRLRHESGFDL